MLMSNMIGVWSLRLLFVASCIALSCANATEYTTTVTETDAHVNETDAPIIIPSKKEIVLQKGQNFTLTCKGSDEVQIQQQEIPEEIVESLFNKTHATFTTSDDRYKYQAELKLYNVDQYAVGYYACFDNTKNGDDVFDELKDEPKDTEHITYIYIYVDGTNTLFAPMREVVKATTGSQVVIGCRPTTPDVKVTLTGSNKTRELKFSPKIGFLIRANRVAYKCEGQHLKDKASKTIRIHSNIPPPIPKITSESEYFISGDDFSLNCTVKYQSNLALALSWSIPNHGSKVINRTNENETTGGILFNNITIKNATAADAGKYTCVSKNSHGQRIDSRIMQHLDKGFINLTYARRNSNLIESKLMLMQLPVDIMDHPQANITYFRDGKEISPMNTKYKLSRSETGRVKLSIHATSVDDTANYTIVATNKYVTKNLTFDVRFKAPPVIDFGADTDMKFVKGTDANVMCKAKGYPKPDITWIFTTHEGQEQILQVRCLYSEKTEDTLTTTTSYISIPVHESGNITCEATNKIDKVVKQSAKSRRFLVYEMSNGFGIKRSDETWFHENQNVVLTCVASIYDFDNLTWTRTNDDEDLDNVEYFDNQYSSVAELKLDNISVLDAGNYTCHAFKFDNTEENVTMAITVAAIRSPIITDPIKEEYKEVYFRLPLQFTCQADAIPRPQILWYKDGVRLLNDSNIGIFNEPLDHTKVNSTVSIKNMLEENRGKYECVAINSVTKAESREFFNVDLTEKPTNKAAYLSAIGGIVFILLLLIVYLAWKIRKEKQFRKELAAAGLLYFKEGVTKSINPELGIDEQAELLPYDERFEFPPEKLKLGVQLGAGAFGVVYKAMARGIMNAEEDTPVAVKMVKKTADNMYIKALATELKIMVHLGKHVNIVNLLGACTKNVGKRELIVIVEYCKFGNIHNYLQKHREVFIDQLTDNKEKNLGKVNKGFLSSSGSSAMHSDYFGSNQTQDTDNTFLNTGNTSRSCRKVSETGYVQPELRSNYETDYSDGRAPRPLFSRDLLAWAFQIARGMEYLASRKVLHGDLAARNVLLAEDNIVKICDFGLARSIYKNDEYQKQENSPLPVKWLAIECLTDRIFSTQSDVWSFGIVLWELFSLAKTPYPNISPPCLLQWLSEGHRLDKPTYANDRLYDVMLRCWAQKPTARPSFTQLQEILGEFLEDNVRNHYVDLNSPYTAMNTKVEGQQDYLEMMCAPDYKNLVTPSPHHYENERSFFPPTPTQYDDEGYLQMSPTNQNIFSPRTTNTKFDFDAKALNPRTEATSHGSESTPMLTLNSIPRSGSESDHENSSPYLNMYPRIEEEADEVFEKNMKNVGNGAVTNPTYITFDVDIEKKPREANYINVPNGLVK